MALIDLQAGLARLYTDTVFRARFFEDPAAAGAEMLLAPAEVLWMASLDRRQVEQFARSLKRKRLASVSEMLPATARALGDRLPELFFAYCDAWPSAPAPVEDARAFVAFLLSSPSLEPPYLRDLASCERIRLELLHMPDDTGDGGTPEAATVSVSADARPQLTPRVRVASFQFDVVRLHPQCARGEPVDAQPDPCFVLLGKVRDSLRVQMKRINLATARLLTACDGARPLATIVEELIEELGLSAADGERLQAECAAFLRPLIASRLVRLRNEPPMVNRPAP